MVVRTLEPGRLIPFLCLDATNWPDSIEVCSVLAKKDAEPVLGKNPRVGSPDEGTCLYATVVIDPETKRFRMWYHGNGKAKLGVTDPTGGFIWTTLYAESEDGLHWERPELGLWEFRGSRKNNIIVDTVKGAHPFHTKAVLRDETEADPGKRFKSLCTASGNQHLSYSPDGIHWVASQLKPIRNMAVAGYHEACCFLLDPDCPDPNKRFKHYSQAWGDENRRPRWDCPAYRTLPGSKIYSTQEQIRRRIGVSYGPDETHMTVWPTLAMDPDEGLEEQVHMISVIPYEGYYLALYEYTSFDFETRTHQCDLRLAASRDGLQFERIQNQVAVVPRGPAGTWDDGCVVGPNQLVKVGDEFWIYYSGAPPEWGWMGSPKSRRPLALEAGYGVQIGRAVLPYDGVSCVRVRSWRLQGSFRSDPMAPGKKLPEFLQANIARPSDTRAHIVDDCAGPVDKAFRISVNEEDGTLIAALEPVVGMEGRFRLPGEILDRRGPKQFRLHVSIDDPYYGIYSLKAL